MTTHEFRDISGDVRHVVVDDGHACPSPRAALDYADRLDVVLSALSEWARVKREPNNAMRELMGRGSDEVDDAEDALLAAYDALKGAE